MNKLSLLCAILMSNSINIESVSRNNGTTEVKFDDGSYTSISRNAFSVFFKNNNEISVENLPISPKGIEHFQAELSKRNAFHKISMFFFSELEEKLRHSNIDPDTIFNFIFSCSPIPKKDKDNKDLDEDVFLKSIIYPLFDWFVSLQNIEWKDVEKKLTLSAEIGKSVYDGMKIHHEDLCKRALAKAILCYACDDDQIRFSFIDKQSAKLSINLDNGNIKNKGDLKSSVDKVVDGIVDKSPEIKIGENSLNHAVFNKNKVEKLMPILNILRSGSKQYSVNLVDNLKKLLTKSPRELHKEFVKPGLNLCTYGDIGKFAVTYKKDKNFEKCSINSIWENNVESSDYLGVNTMRNIFITISIAVLIIAILSLFLSGLTLLSMLAVFGTIGMGAASLFIFV